MFKQANSEILFRVQTEFHNMIRGRKNRRETDIGIICFYEELPFPGLGFVGDDLHSHRGTDTVQVVDRQSASLPYYQCTGLAYNHSEMTRFKDASDPAFLAVTSELQRWSKSIIPPARPETQGE